MNSLESFARFMPMAATTPHSSMTMRSNILTDVELKARKYANTLNDCQYEVSNEPSLGFYRVQEHVRKSMPNLIEKNNELTSFRSKLQGSSFDLDYSLDAIVKMSRAVTTLESIESLLTDSLYAARQLHLKNLKSNSENLPSTQSHTSPRTSSNAKEKVKNTLNYISTKTFRKGSTASVNENLNNVSSSPLRSQTMVISDVISESKQTEAKSDTVSYIDETVSKKNEIDTVSKELDEEIAENECEKND